MDLGGAATRTANGPGGTTSTVTRRRAGHGERHHPDDPAHRLKRKPVARGRPAGVHPARPGVPRLDLGEDNTRPRSASEARERERERELQGFRDMARVSIEAHADAPPGRRERADGRSS